MNALVDSQIDTPAPSVIALWWSGPRSQAGSVLAPAPLTCALRRGSTILHDWFQSKPDGYLSVQYIKAPGKDGETKECDAERRGPGRTRERTKITSYNGDGARCTRAPQTSSPHRRRLLRE